MGNQQVSLDNLYLIAPLGNNYYHDNKGNVYSTKRGSLKQLKNMVAPGKTNKTYLRVKISERCYMVHHMVLMEKYGRKLLKGESGNHLNGDTTDNRRENLEIATHAEQVAHAVANGLYCSGNAWREARGLSTNVD